MSTHGNSSNNSNSGSSSSEGSYCYIAGYDAGSGANFSVQEGNDIVTETIQAGYCQLTGQSESYGQGYEDGVNATNPSD